MLNPGIQHERLHEAALVRKVLEHAPIEAAIPAPLVGELRRLPYGEAKTVSRRLLASNHHCKAAIERRQSPQRQELASYVGEWRAELRDPHQPIDCRRAWDQDRK